MERGGGTKVLNNVAVARRGGVKMERVGGTPTQRASISRTVSLIALLLLLGKRKISANYNARHGGRQEDVQHYSYATAVDFQLRS